MRATQLTHIGIDQFPMMTDQSITIRTRWNSATTAKITPVRAENLNPDVLVMQPANQGV